MNIIFQSVRNLVFISHLSFHECLMPVNSALLSKKHCESHEFHVCVKQADGLKLESFIRRKDML